ncbi:hypothetical protein SECTIM467_96 [Brevibacillus phage SecTim467]|uniref:Uncharacterized protein n=2 Tax=Jenstvirus jenst TaxID=1982225 RepID=A0A0K2CNN7_9CAUD|nr:hypothetical protein AVV11_gp100 [Brevibacillus phage Jenst]ALA07220.1 hypothetical protein JENST_91 [Brevibacillus phage Jenst]ALA07437.1 hypothetical protein SECTIM467_96 [Brevibacillus phage SecTim467]
MCTVDVGQLVEVSYKPTISNEGFWVYGVVTGLYDKQFAIKTELGNRLMYHTKGEDGAGIPDDFISKNIAVTPLFKGGQPVLVRKTLFGAYKFPK